MESESSFAVSDAMKGESIGGRASSATIVWYEICTGIISTCAAAAARARGQVGYSCTRVVLRSAPFAHGMAAVPCDLRAV